MERTLPMVKCNNKIDYTHVLESDNRSTRFGVSNGNTTISTKKKERKCIPVLQSTKDTMCIF